MVYFPEKNLKMSEEEMGRIALAYLRAKYAKGFRIHSQFVKDIGEKAKECGVSLDRAKIFAEIMVREAVEEAFPSYSPATKKDLLGPAFRNRYRP